MPKHGLIDGLLHLISPELCYLCWCEPPLAGDKLCIHCIDALPVTVDFDLVHNNVSLHLFGRVPIKHAAAALNYWPDSPIKEVLHQLKYGGKKELGIWLGRVMAPMIRDCPLIDTIDVLTYVPIHEAKQRRRGYNQSRIIAEGITQILPIPIVDQAITKHKISDSQTRKSRVGRLDNVATVFELTDNTYIAGKSVLLIDDVITTGATIEAAARQLINGGCKDIYVITAAVARM